MVFIHVSVDLYTYMNLSYSDLVLALSPQLRILRGSEVRKSQLYRSWQARQKMITPKLAKTP